MDKYVENQEITTEERILWAAEREFLEKGYAGARTTSIAEAAGVTHAMLHYYFRTKENLFQHILGEKVINLRGLILLDLLNKDSPLLDKVKAAVETHFDFLASNPELPRFLLTELPGNQEFSDFFRKKINEDNRDIVELFQREIDTNAKQKLCRNVDARMLLLDIISLNAFSFVAAPLVNNILGDIIMSEDFLMNRKKNNVEIIMQKLKP